MPNYRRPTRVGGLHRVYFGPPGEKFWIGALNWGTATERITNGKNYSGSFLSGLQVGDPIEHSDLGPEVKTGFRLSDTLFYIRESTTDGNEIVVDQYQPVSSKGKTFEFLNYTYTDNTDEDKNFYGIVANGYDPPIRIGRFPDPDTKVCPRFAYFIPSNVAMKAEAGTADYEPTDPENTDLRADFAITAPRSIEVYVGSVVYAGYHTVITDFGGSAIDYSHWAAFSLPVGVEHSCYTVDSGATVQIGDSPAEPIQKVSTISTQTDSMGIKGQLAFFTHKRIKIFDGLPPIPSRDTTGENVAQFTSAAFSDIGTYAPKSVTKTPYGLVFLGSDGVVYLLPNAGHPLAIGRALEPLLSKYSPQRMSVCAGSYFKGYYLLSCPVQGGAQVNSQQFWADMRGLKQSERDLGVRWSGPHTNQWIDCMAVAGSGGDANILMGGSSVDGKVVQLFMRDRMLDPANYKHHANQESPVEADTIAIRSKIVSPELDLGNAHVDKDVVRLSLGVASNTETRIKMHVAVPSAQNAGSLSRISETFTEDVTPTVGAVTTGTDILGVTGAFELIDKRPSTRLRGRAVNVTITDEYIPASGKEPVVSFQDLEVNARVIGRRS